MFFSVKAAPSEFRYFLLLLHYNGGLSVMGRKVRSSKSGIVNYFCNNLSSHFHEIKHDVHISKVSKVEHALSELNMHYKRLKNVKS